MDALCRDQRKSLAQVEPHLVTKHGEGPRPGAIILAHAGVADPAHEVQVGLHCATAKFPDGTRARYA